MVSTSEDIGSSSSAPGSAYARLRRSLSSRKYFAKAPSPKTSNLPTPINDSTEHFPPFSDKQPERTDQISPKLTSFERFIKFGRKKRDGPIELPPSSWLQKDASQTEDVAIEAPSEALSPAQSADTNLPHHDGESLESSATPSSTIDGAELEANVEDDEPTPEPTSLAWRIQTLLALLPSILPYTPTTPPDAREGDGSAPPAPSAFIADSRLISLLSSPSVMNGSLSKGRQSVWSVLDRLRAKAVEPSPSQGADSGDVGVEGTPLREETMEDDSSFMLYSPLVPTPQSEVELARSEIVSVQEEAEEVIPLPAEQAQAGNVEEPRAHARGLWPFSSSSKVVETAGGESHARVVKTTERRVWVPSTTQISLQVMWWGYRVYLPPPVLSLLDNKQLEAGKRAAMLTTSLKWLLDHIPVTAVPPQLRPALTILRSLVPYVAYIGGFIAWSWSTIKTFDKGNGVILTATWLLPVAVIPGTWEDTNDPNSQPP